MSNRLMESDVKEKLQLEWHLGELGVNAFIIKYITLHVLCKNQYGADCIRIWVIEQSAKE